MRVLISGGGIGGLTAALQLHKAGHSVRVFESARNIVSTEVGAGVTLQPHATSVLLDLGLGERLLDPTTSGLTGTQSFYTKTGQLITAIPKGEKSGNGQNAPMVPIHRGKLHRLLFDACIERLGKDGVLAGHRGIRYEQDGMGVRLEVLDRPTGATFWAEGDVLVCADGIHSPLRGQMHPELDVTPHQSGVLLMRGVTMMPPFLDGKSLVIAGDSMNHLVAHPIGECEYAKNLQLINWVLATEVPAEVLSKFEASYGAKVDGPEDVLRHLEGFDLPFLDYASMIRNARHIFRWPMVDRDPLDRWTDGRVVLIGDAAHAMYPVGANGGSTAILDTTFLTEILKGISTEEVPTALEDFAAKRAPICKSIQGACREQAWMEIIDEVHNEVPRGVEVPNEYGERVRALLASSQRGK